MQPIQAVPVSDYTRDEIRYLVARYGSRHLSIAQFYEWLPYCLTQRKKLYSRRDAAKFIFVANALNRIRNLEIARDLLAQDLEINSHKYQES